MAMMVAIKEGIWLQDLLDDLGIDQGQLKINCDSTSAIYLARNQVYHAQIKHIDVRFHFVREILDDGDIKLLKIHTTKNPTDMLTVRGETSTRKRVFYETNVKIYMC